MHVAQNWRMNAQRYALKGVKCEKCGTLVFPPREVCPSCEQPKQYTLTQAPAIIDLPRYEVRQAAR